MSNYWLDKNKDKTDGWEAWFGTFHLGRSLESAAKGELFKVLLTNVIYYKEKENEQKARR